ncbi:MAG: helix-turn-helix domain-containing protein [Bacteroidetes bacterium]|nr:helix-turn-helix domain-containing protein [Bacteroidota bacterium]
MKLKNLKKKRLSKEKAAEIVKLLGEGRDAKELADTYKVSIATIYNFRTRLKREGAPVAPKKRGRKPKLAKSEILPNTASQEPKKLETTVKMEQYIFVINGVAVSVSGKAKNVHISKDSMIVNF